MCYVEPQKRIHCFKNGCKFDPLLVFITHYTFFSEENVTFIPKQGINFSYKFRYSFLRNKINTLIFISVCPRIISYTIRSYLHRNSYLSKLLNIQILQVQRPRQVWIYGGNIGSRRGPREIVSTGSCSLHGFYSPRWRYLESICASIYPL